MTLIQNIKNKNEKSNETGLSGTNSINKTNSKQNEPHSTNETSQLANYSHILKALNKKRKVLTTENSNKKFKKAQYKDYADECTVSVVDNKLRTLNFFSGQITLKANIIGFKSKTSTQKEQILIEWFPKNILENEWIEKSQFTETKTVPINELNLQSKTTQVSNAFNQMFRNHRFRPNRRK